MLQKNQGGSETAEAFIHLEVFLINTCNCCISCMHYIKLL